MRALDRSSPARVFRLDRASSSLARRPARPSRVATSPDYLPSQHTSTDRRPFFLSFPSPQAAVVGVSTVLLASPAFAATIKLGGDNGELGFFVRAPPRPARLARSLVADVVADKSIPPRLERKQCNDPASLINSSTYDQSIRRPDPPADVLFPPLFSSQPNKISVAKGETVEFVNNKAFPHNVVFDEDNVPAGVNADAISHEDYLNGPGEKVTNKFDVAGTYGYYCEPHQGAGMQGTIVVS
jgi:plastocyanin